MGICEILTIIFVICKLCGIITWSWWLVLLPEIIGIVFIILFALGVAKLDRGDPLRRWRL